MKMKKSIKSVLPLLLLSLAGYAQDKNQFQTPPNSAKPRVWWHWMNGNITKEGIQKDLEWMSRVGIGGFQNFDANLFTPVVVPRKLVFMTPEWKDAFKFMTQTADQKGLEMAIAGSPGWSVTGGPWVEPKDAMKKYVWTETRIEGGKAFTGKLPRPADVIGKFQNVLIGAGGLTGGFVGEKPNFYQDALVIAYRLPKADKPFAELNPKVTSSGGKFTLKDLNDSDLSNAQFVPPMEVGQDMWIQYEFETPQTFKAFSIAGAIESALSEFRGAPENRSLKVSDDGVNFREIAKVSGSTVPLNTVAFAPVTAKFWRIAIKTLPPAGNPFGGMMGNAGGGPAKSDGVNVAEFVLYNTTRIDQWEDKAGFSPWKEAGNGQFPNVDDAINTEDVIDITGKMSADGTLNWTAPAGNWSVLRLGYSLTGRQNHPASPEATGLEVDKLDKEAVRKYINTYLDMYKDATGGLMGAKGLHYMVLDSYEAGHMNWTKSFPDEFRKRRGYDLKTWVPVLTGRIVKSPQDSEKFLWDFRKTIGELIAENHYDVIGEELKKRGMQRYTESHEGGRIYLADGMDVKRNSDIPMSAMWTPGSLAGGADEEVRSEADIRESASVANIYGKPFVAAESMTSVGKPFQEHPERLKRTADLEMASGLNRFVIHTSVHQPLDDKKPGFSLGPFGQYFTRQETWAEAGGKAWMAYLGRSCYLLQQGRNVADVLYYYGENNNITWICREKLPTIPAGYEFDFVNSSALINAIQAKNGKLVAQSGNTYSVLVLDESATWMTLPVLKKIKTLVDAGVKVIGAKPQRSPSLADNDAEFQKIADEVWKKSNVIAATANANVETRHALSLQQQPDVIIENTKNKIVYRHRQTADQDIYWLNNRSGDATEAEVSFRVTGKVPEWWDPATGKTEKVSYRIKDGRTVVPLKFEAWDAFFIIFKDKATTAGYTKPATTETALASISTPWTVSMNGKNVSMDKLTSWTESTDTDVKYFSGTATYDNTFKVASVDKSERYVVDLGDVKNIAEVIVNGKNVGVAWKKPFKVDITDAVKAGDNSIQVNVTNLWPNRLIGDAQPDVKQKTTFTTMPFYRADSPLLPSGMMGEVKVSVVK
ncbi:glycosyl hydrolase [Runella slithyformis]|uniref:Coagulation factor 5/8 type domain protein n=1 Tax=Runella slithyformis (strain ATCC 29530 / DSM 19594 / LMG 11500 / NCIMB 11436 / LSU 4) TaxID=761193 RepID=A0A7U4E3Z5_RUNSL|nr:coagulation factor 5/8 type domain protein [Runella slithyformis DSM 19594]